MLHRITAAAEMLHIRIGAAAEMLHIRIGAAAELESAEYESSVKILIISRNENEKCAAKGLNATTKRSLSRCNKMPKDVLSCYLWEVPVVPRGFSLSMDCWKGP